LCWSSIRPKQTSCSLDGIDCSPMLF
jgi:hypothetical protein